MVVSANGVLGAVQRRVAGGDLAFEGARPAPGKQSLLDDAPVQRRSASGAGPASGAGGHADSWAMSDGLSAALGLGGGAEVSEPAPVQRKSVAAPAWCGSGVVVQARGAVQQGEQVGAIAAHGVAGASSALPHAEAIQRSFGSHDVGGVRAQVGGEGAESARAIGAEAYTTGNRVAFAQAPDLHTAAHEAAHVVQQAHGVNLYGGVGTAGDVYERHADAVADRVVAGESAEQLLSVGPSASASGAGVGVQRKESADGATAEGGGSREGASGAEAENDAVFGGVVRSVLADKTPLVSDASKPATTEVVKLAKTNQVTPVDLGVGAAANKGVEGTGKAWWKVKIVKGANVGKEGWVQAEKLGSILSVKKAGKSEYSGKVGAGQVEIHTGQALEKEGADDGDNNFALTYTGKDAADTRWLQFIWREVIGVDAKGASTPIKGSITTTGGTYDLTDNGTAAKPGTPAKNNYNTDCPNSADPFYEAFGEADRTADSTKMIDLPGPMTPKVEAAFKAGAKSVVSRAHFTTFLVQARKVTFKTKIDILWDFKKKEDAAAPPAGAHTVSESGAATELPKTIAERFHDQYPGFKDIK